MAMQINDESNFSFFVDFRKETFDCCDFRAICLLFSRIPFTVQIFPSKVSSIVTKDDAIRIDHWNYIDYIVFSDELSFFRFVQQFIYDSITDIGALSFPRMLPSHEYYSLTGILFLIVSIRRYHNNLDILFGQSFPNTHFHSYILIFGGNCPNFLLQFCVSIRERTGNIDFIVSYHRFEFKAKLIIMPSRIFSRNLTFFIYHFSSYFMPT